MKNYRRREIETDREGRVRRRRREIDIPRASGGGGDLSKRRRRRRSELNPRVSELKSERKNQRKRGEACVFWRKVEKEGKKGEEYEMVEREI